MGKDSIHINLFFHFSFKDRYIQNGQLYSSYSGSRINKVRNYDCQMIVIFMDENAVLIRFSLKVIFAFI